MAAGAWSVAMMLRDMGFPRESGIGNREDYRSIRRKQPSGSSGPCTLPDSPTPIAGLERVAMYPADHAGATHAADHVGQVLAALHFHREQQGRGRGVAFDVLHVLDIRIGGGDRRRH